MWKHFARRREPYAYESQCLNCHKVFAAASTSTLRYHLEQSHDMVAHESEALMEQFLHRESTLKKDLYEHVRCLTCDKEYRKPSTHTLRYHMEKVHGVSVAKMFTATNIEAQDDP